MQFPFAEYRRSRLDRRDGEFCLLTPHFDNHAWMSLCISFLGRPVLILAMCDICATHIFCALYSTTYLWPAVSETAIYRTKKVKQLSGERVEPD